MTVIITGTTKKISINQAIQRSGFKVNYIITGDTRGVERVAQQYGKTNKIPVFMLKTEDFCDASCALILIWDGKDAKLQALLDQAKQNNLKIYEELV